LFTDPWKEKCLLHRSLEGEMSPSNQLKIRKHKFMEIDKKGIMIHITEKLKASTTKKRIKDVH